MTKSEFTADELKLLEYGLRLVRADSIGQIEWARKEPSVAPEGYEDEHRRKILRTVDLIEKLGELKWILSSGAASS